MEKTIAPLFIVWAFAEFACWRSVRSFGGTSVLGGVCVASQMLVCTVAGGLCADWRQATLEKASSFLFSAGLSNGKIMLFLAEVTCRVSDFLGDFIC